MDFIDRIILSVTNRWLYSRNYALIKAAYDRHGWWPNVARPERYSERMLWRKIVDRNADFVIYSDKLLTKGYTQERCPDLAVPKTLWVGTDADAIPDELLLGDVYVKTNHGSTFYVHVRDGKVDRAALKKQTDAWLAITYGTDHCEWGYSQVTPRLYVEETIGKGGAEMVEFEFRVANGRVLFASMVGSNKTPQQWRVYLDDDGELGATPALADKTTITVCPLKADHRAAFKKARKYAGRLGEGIDYARIDLFWDGTQLYAGEITLYPGAGIMEIASPASNKLVLGGWRLLDSAFFRNPQPWPMSIYAGALRRSLERAEKKKQEAAGTAA